MGRPQQHLLLTAAFCLVSLIAAQSSLLSADVATNEQLQAALQSGATRIVLQNDVALDFADQFVGQPLKINRNVTITGPDGTSTSIDAAPVLDLSNSVGILELCSSCLFRFLGVSLANENKAGTGSGISAFRGQPGSRVEWDTGVGVRTACPPATPQLQLINATQRSGLFPSPPGGQQLARIVNVTYRGKQYKDVLRVVDLSSDVTPQQLTDSAFTGGYAIRRRNTTRLCQNIVSSACLQRRQPEDCIAELQEGGSRGARASGQGGGSDNWRAIAIAVPVAVGGALLLLAAALLLWRWRRRRHRQHRLSGGLTAPKPAAAGAGAGAGGAGATPAAREGDPDLDPQMGLPAAAVWPAGAAAAAAATAAAVSDPPDAEALMDQAAAGQQAGPRPAPAKQANSSSLTQKPLALVAGSRWQVLWSSSPHGAVWESEHDNIDLGMLLGAGSFARVYKGRWSGLDVAVKVINHSLDSAASIIDQAQLKLSLNHPNVVRAYYCITKQLLPAEAASSGAQDGSGSADGQPGLPAPSGPHSMLAAPRAAAEPALMLQGAVGWAGAGVRVYPQAGSSRQAAPSAAVSGAAAPAAAAAAAGVSWVGTSGGSVSWPASPGPPVPQVATVLWPSISSTDGPLLQYQPIQQQQQQWAPAESPVAASASPTQQQQQQQLKGFAVLPHAPGGSGSSWPGAGRLASLTTGSAALQPLTPPPSTNGAVLYTSNNSSNPMASSSVPEATPSSSTGFTSWEHYVQDLDSTSMPAYQRKLRQPLSPLPSAAASDGDSSGESSTARSATLQQQPLGSTVESFARSSSGGSGTFRIRLGLPVGASGSPDGGVSAAGEGYLIQSSGSGSQPLPTALQLMQLIPQSAAAVVGSGSRGSLAGLSSGSSLLAGTPSAAAVAAAVAAWPRSASPPPVLAVVSGTSNISAVSSPSARSSRSVRSQAWPVIVSPSSSEQLEELGSGLAAADVGPGLRGRGATAAAGAAAAAGGGGEGGGVVSGSSIPSTSSLRSNARGRQVASKPSVDPAVMCETWLVLELCDRGTLARQAAEWQPESDEQDMLRLLHLLRDVAHGLQLLKSQHIVHADLNAHNVLVASSPVAPFGLVAKVADLGLSRVLQQHATHRTTRTVGMLTHQPPELLRNGRMSPAVDIYSFGVMMFEAFTRQAAFARLRYGQVYHQVVVLGARPEVPADMPEDYELLMKRCWAAAPSERPSVDMLVECLDLMIQDRQ